MAQSFRKRNNQGQQRLSETTWRMVQALWRVFTAELSEAIRRRGVDAGRNKVGSMGS